MILTDYYRMEKLPDQKSKMRLDCVKSTRSYPEFEIMRNKAGEFFFYFHDVPERFGGDIHRKADKAITKTKNISSVFVPDVQQKFGYGDIRGTNDALLFIFNDNFSEIDLFVARGQRHNKRQLYLLLTEGELDHEIEFLKKQAVTDLVTKLETELPI